MNDRPDHTLNAPSPATEPPAPAGPPASALRRALEVLGDPWTMLILKEAFNGVRRFSAFQRALNIPRQTLSLRLTALCREQMLYRRHVSPVHATLEYAPTAKALDLEQAMYSVWLWHRANPGGADVLPFDIVHRACGQVLEASFRCVACNGVVRSVNVSVRRSLPLQFDPEPRARLSRRNDAAFAAAADPADDSAGAPAAQSGLIAASLVGDIPANEILHLLFREPLHIQEIARQTGLGASVVRDRLQKLAALDLVSEQARGRKVLYAPRPRAEGFYPLLISIAAWGDRWCNGDQPPPEILTHDCGALLKARFVCDHCGGPVTRDSVRIVLRDG